MQLQTLGACSHPVRRPTHEGRVTDIVLSSTHVDWTEGFKVKITSVVKKVPLTQPEGTSVPSQWDGGMLRRKINWEVVIE